MSDRFARVGLQFGFVVEGIHLRGGAFHAQKQDPFGPGGVMSDFGKQRIIRRICSDAAIQGRRQCSKGQPAESRSGRVQEATP